MVRFIFLRRSDKVPLISVLQKESAQDASGLRACARVNARGNVTLNQEAEQCGKHWNKSDR